MVRKPIISWDFGLRLLDNDYLVTKLMQFKDELANFNWDYILVASPEGGMRKVTDPDRVDNRYDWLKAAIPELEKMCKERGIDFEKEMHRHEMYERYAFVMDNYIEGSVAGDMRVLEKGNSRYVIECNGRKAVVEFDPDWSEYVYTVNGRGPYAHSSYEFIGSDIYDTLTCEYGEHVKLAAKLNDFYRDFDFYDYMDGAVGDEQVVIDDLAEQLNDANAVDGILEALRDIKENGEPDAEQLQALDALIEEVGSVRVRLVGSLDEKLSDAKEKSSLLENGISETGKEIDFY